MSKETRIKLIGDIEKERGTKLLIYITSTRGNLEVPMAIDVIRLIYEHLKVFKEEERKKIDIDLFLVSNGGEGVVPWKLVTLIREYAKKFSVLIPFRAFSAATLTSLGADEVIMHPMGMLGPTDPTVSNQFNPADPNNPNIKLGISVEDVSAYISLIKEDAGITHEDELIQAFLKLAEKVHPLALGNVKRSLSQSRMMAKKLLSLHMSNTKEQHQIQEIVDNLTSKLYYHGHPINRKEAFEEVGLKTVKNAPVKTEKLMWDLFLEYEKELKSDTPFDPLMEFIAHNKNLGISESATIEIESKLAFIESSVRTDFCSIAHSVFGTKNKNGSYQITPNIIERSWKIE